MAKALFNVFFKVIKTVLNIFMAPINALIVGLFPSLGTIISSFNAAVTLYVGGGMSYFFSLIPPASRYLIMLWLSILISYYGIIFTYHIVLKIIQIIKRIKIW